MPCYEIRIVSVSFQISNIDLLKRALVNAGFKRIEWSENDVRFENGGSIFNISFVDSKISSRYIEEKILTGISNQIKRAYSLEVINELAQKQKWIKKSMGNNVFQLQRF